MKKLIFCAAILFSALTFDVCAADFKGYRSGDNAVLPAEDLDVLSRYSDLIGVLKDPKLKSASEEKYLAAKKLLEHVDITFVRETKTLDQLFYHGDVIIDDPTVPNRNLTFYYAWQDHYVRMVFHTYMKFVLRVDVYQQ